MSSNLLGRDERLLMISCLFVFVLLTVDFPGLSRVTVVQAEEVNNDAELPPDVRLEPLRHLDSYFPFTPAASPGEWETRAEQLRRRILVSLGLWPMPTRNPLDPVIHGRIDRGDYTVEKVFFESMPGFYVTGNLYRPVGKTGKQPGVICPHGHWRKGRFYEGTDAEILASVAEGGEQFYEGGRSPLQARCVGLARMGCVVFHYDMLGYADSQQLSFELVHLYGQQAREMNTVENWGLFSAPAEAHSQSGMGLQTFNSIRALDFITSLPDVDPDRIAVTGASGGGTQTFLLCAVDPRPAIAFPAVMVSTAMQGGCTCENACGLRISTGNVEFAALFAPKPMGLSAANDWTREMDTKGFPELQAHYRMMGAPDNVTLVNRTEFEHNYNSVSRNAMYHLVNKHFHLGLDEPIQDRDYPRLSQGQMTVWVDEHPAPDSSVDFERGLLRWWHEDSQKQLAEVTPTDADSLEEFRELIGAGLDVVIGRNLSNPKICEWEPRDSQDRNGVKVNTGRLHNKADGEVLPIVELMPAGDKNHFVIWLDANGKSGLFDKSGEPISPVQKLLDAGTAVYGVDLLYQGEFLADDQPLVRTRQVETKIGIDTPRKMTISRDAAAYTFGYNFSLFAQRVHDVLSVVGYLRESKPAGCRIDLVGLRGAGHWAAAALGQANGMLSSVAIDAKGFRFANVLDLFHPDFLPGGAKYGDLPGMIAMGAPTQLWLASETSESIKLAVRVFGAAGAEAKLNLSTAEGDAVEQESVDWLLNL